MNRNLTIFLDLEETLIDDWRHGNWLSNQTDAILSLIQTRMIEINPFETSLGLMSWAVENFDDKLSFMRRFSHTIENHFDLKFQSHNVLSVSDWRIMINRISGINFSNDDFNDFATKENVLFWLRNAHESILPEGFIILVDDTVSHLDKIVTEKRVIEFINPKQLTT